MNKKDPKKAFSIQGSDIRQYKKTEAYVAAIEKLFNQAITEFSQLATRTDVNPDKPFSFADYPSTRHTAQNIINKLAANMQVVVQKGSREAWLYACKKNDDFLRSILNTSKLGKRQLNKMQDRNLDALHAFQKRKIGGMDLSKRVWNHVSQFKDQIELGLDAGLGEGRSAQQLARDVKENLNDPDRLFRRVRDKRGVLRLSKAAKVFHPGSGVYRSATRNAERLARTEINMGYRESECLRWAALDFVIGFTVMRSNRKSKSKCKLCERLKGRYPKTFIFKGWHPQCLCFLVPILQDPEEFDTQELDEMKAALQGKEYKKYASPNTVTDVPEEFKKWVEENREASKNWHSAPYFVKDNFTGGNLAGGLKLIKPIIQPGTIQERPPEEVKTKGKAKNKAVSPNMPDEMKPDGRYVKETGIEFKKGFFDLIDPKKPISFIFSKEIKGAYYLPFKRTVNIADDDRIKASKWERESVVYHEYGHAIDFQRGLQKEVNPLMVKYNKLLAKKTQRNIYIKEYSYAAGGYIYKKQKIAISDLAYADHRLQELTRKIWNMDNKTFEKLGISKHDVIEQIGCTRDTIMSINPSYGAGHSKTYFQQSGMRQTEFIAHAFENAFATNRVFKKVLPELYEEMVKFIKDLK